MKNVTTKYGALHGLSSIEMYAEGSIKECTLNEENYLQTKYGSLIPQFEDNGVRLKHIHSLSFYENENLKSISLQNQTLINTTLGEMKAEYLTFYEDESIKRIFPLNGKLSGYWSEENEYELAENFEFSFAFGKFSTKVISILFYNSGKVKSLTLWPQNRIKVNTSLGLINVRTGIALYETGNIKSLEPSMPVLVETKIGKIMAYDNNPIGVHGDLNSLNFYNNGEIKSLITSTDRIVVNDKNGKQYIHQPQLKQSIIDDNEEEIVPMSIEFCENKIIIDYNDEYEIDKYDFEVENMAVKLRSSCSSCASCSGCSSL